MDAGPCPNGVQGGDGTVPYPRWPVPTGDSRATNEFTTTANTVLDHATCLMWQRNVDANVYSWDAAKTFCDNLVIDGLADWRLPTRAELISLTDFTVQAPAINDTVFPGTEGGTTAGDGRYWSSTVTAFDANRHWTLAQGAIGQTSYFGAPDNSRVRCVRGAGAPSGPRFDATVTGVVSDNETGLMWEAAPPDADHDPAQAKAHCDALLLAGHDDWRVPSLRELLLLIDPTMNGPALPAEFTTKLGAWYWSTTLVVTTTNAYWGVAFNSGFSQPEGGSTVYDNPRVRCVR